MSETDLKQAAAEQTGDFNPEQKRYLEGFVAGVQIAKAAKSVSGSAAAGRAAPAPEPVGPDAAGLKAQSRLLAGGGKLADQEKWKREHPFDAYARFKAQARAGAFPKPDDNFRWRYFGLFYVAPAQSSYMMRLRIPNGILSHAQFAGLADLAERYGGGYADVTTRANSRFAKSRRQCATAIVEAVEDLGCARAARAPTISAMSPAADSGDRSAGALRHAPSGARMAFSCPQRPLADRPAAQVQRRLRRRRPHRHARGNQRHRLSGGPCRRAARRRAGRVVPRRVGGITGHRDIARDVGVCATRELTAIADAIVRVFIDSGDRTDRTKARLKYVLDGWGVEKFLAAVEARLAGR